MSTIDPRIAQTLKDLNKAYGDGSAKILTHEHVVNVAKTPTGSLNVDLAIGGGWPEGRMMEIYGPESAGKTTMATLAAIEFQRKYPEKFISFIDVEHSYDPVRASILGLDMDRVIFSQPSTAEEALNIAESWARNGAVSLIIIDSIAALVPEAEDEGGMEDQQIGLQARLLGKFCRKITDPLQKTGTALICINQIREKVGFVMGNPETTPGGRALKFYSSVRMEVRAGERLTGKNKDDVLGQVVKVKIVKNKVGNPFKTAMFELIYNHGVNNIMEVVEIMALTNSLIKSGAYLKLVDETGEILVKDGQKLNMYKKDWCEYLEKRPELYEYFKNCVVNAEQIDLDYIRKTEFVVAGEEFAYEEVDE